MKVTIAIDDDGEVTEMSVDLDRFKGIPPALRLLSVVLGYHLARTYFLAVTAGVNVLIGEYTRAELVARKAEIRQIVGL